MTSLYLYRRQEFEHRCDESSSALSCLALYRSGDTVQLALRAAGITNAAVYDGSWKDWGNDPDRPVEAEV